MGTALGVCILGASLLCGGIRAEAAPQGGRSAWKALPALLPPPAFEGPAGRARQPLHPRRWEELEHVPGSLLGGLGSGFSISIRALSFFALASGAGLLGAGVLFDYSYRVPSLIAGSVLLPLGARGLFFSGDSSTPDWPLPGGRYTLQDYDEDIRYIYARPGRDKLARKLMKKFPELHREFLWSLRIFGGDEDDSEEEKAFVRWYRSLAGG